MGQVVSVVVAGAVGRAGGILRYILGFVDGRNMLMRQK